jgi:hypothetical protein
MDIHDPEMVSRSYKPCESFIAILSISQYYTENDNKNTSNDMP